MHYHAHAGLCGYLPNYTSTHRTYKDAVEDLANLHDLGKRRRAVLNRDGYLDMNIHRDGNEYCEITECQEDDCEKELAEQGD